ncbi:GTP-binding protein [Cordyceps militaris CM01]|uniref:GTP-binding protein n=1 Tax=Cordyceps militaris (strain CM01) TaxID=983644 RepID=G3J6D2_CORMM|nr:GTP-binding protein [Cordyceps militaris CM01]EGX96166.1 GTP-binding protein [Cordyceps militaris CM01]
MAPTIESSLETQGLASEQTELLNLIDKLQFAQLDSIKLPQIVVVGDQSAGKSSVLEALSGTPFPRDAGACTRFATEIRLRRAKEARLKVSIIPDKTRPYNEQTKLLQYGGDVTGDMPFETLMREATELIAPKNIPGRFAAKDILVVEKTGPEMPLLTLVDLPGLVRVANRDQSEADIATIEHLSDRYMKSSRTIILAVIGGNNDYVQAPILTKTRQFDPNGSRTIGVLTKPDMTEGIGLEDKFVELVMNKDEENHFKLGWYVLLNPGPGEQWTTAADRNRRETEFFTRGKWANLPPEIWGIASLRQKLSSQLQRHIGKHVKSLRRQIQQALERCEGQLKEMGEGRDTVEEMRIDLGELFAASNNLVTPAVNGNYKNPFGERFFARQSSPKGTPSQQLRARVREESERFARLFRQQGRKVNFSEPSTANLPSAGTVGDQSKKDFAQREVEPLLRQIRGNELPLDSNPRAPYILFQDYSRNWPVLAQEYKDNLSVICNEFLVDLISHIWPMRMRDPLHYHFLESKMRELFDNGDKELTRLTDDMELELQPFDPEYEVRLRKWRADATANGGTYTEAEEVLEKMLIYYDLTARIFTRNIITQVVERHLLLGMLRLFNPVEILRMPNSTIESIVAENKETRDRRLMLKEQKKAIEEARNICASLAMRSDLRAYADEADDDVDTDTDSPTTSRSTIPQQPVNPQPAPSRRSAEANRQGYPEERPRPAAEANRQGYPEERPRPAAEANRQGYPEERSRPAAEANRQERPRPAVDARGRPQQAPQPPYQQPSAPVAHVAPAAPSFYQEQSRERDPAYYATAASSGQPHHGPPPPRPHKEAGYEESNGYYDAAPTQNGGGRGHKDSARQRLVASMPQLLGSLLQANPLGVVVQDNGVCGSARRRAELDVPARLGREVAPRPGTAASSRGRRSRRAGHTNPGFGRRTHDAGRSAKGGGAAGGSAGEDGGRHGCVYSRGRLGIVQENAGNFVVGVVGNEDQKDKETEEGQGGAQDRVDGWAVVRRRRGAAVGVERAGGALECVGCDSL